MPEVDKIGKREPNQGMGLVKNLRTERSGESGRFNGVCSDTTINNERNYIWTRRDQYMEWRICGCQRGSIVAFAP